MRNALTALAAVLLTAVSATAQTTWYVDGSKPCPGFGTQQDPFCKIQSGIDAAAPGDTVLVRPCTYFENIVVNKAITVRSEDPATSDIARDRTIIDGSHNPGAAVVTFQGNPGPVLQGFTIQGGSSSGYGAGVYCYMSSPTVCDCCITGNQASYGSAIAAIGSQATFDRLVICNNSAGQGTIWSSATSDAIIKDRSIFCNCLVVHNQAGSGAGFGINEGEPVIDLVTIAYNTGDTLGAIWADLKAGERPTVTNCIIWENGEDPIDPEFASCPLTYCDVQYGSGQPWFGPGCVEADPLFVNPTGDCSGNYHLLPNSPCIDAGDPGREPRCDGACCAFDIDGEPRPWGDPLDRVDMGCDEVWPSVFECVHGSGITGMVAKWHFDEGTGTIFYDSKDSHHGEMRNGNWWTNNGFCNGAVWLDGIVKGQRHLVVPDDPGIGEEDLAQSLAIYLFFRLDDLPPAGSSYYLYEKDLNYWALVDSSGLLQAGIWAPGPPPTRVGLSSSSRVASGQWYHVLFTFESPIDRARLWLNGSLEKENTSFTAEMASSDAALVIGEGAGHPDHNPMYGTIDEMTIGTFAPWILLDGDFRPGGRVDARYGLRPNKDLIFAIVGLPPADCSACNWCAGPFDGALCLPSFWKLFVLGSWFLPEFVLSGDIPPDAGLRGLTVLFQALVGDFGAIPPDAAWTNCAVLTIP
ncbi:MAG: LamG domain-containing protein [Planctomycetota bacterium]